MSPAARSTGASPPALPPPEHATGARPHSRTASVAAPIVARRDLRAPIAVERIPVRLVSGPVAAKTGRRWGDTTVRPVYRTGLAGAARHADNRRPTSYSDR